MHRLSNGRAVGAPLILATATIGVGVSATPAGVALTGDMRSYMSNREEGAT